MTAVFRRAVMFVLHRAEAGVADRREHQIGALAWHADQPAVVGALGQFDPISVTLEGATEALVDEWNEPSGVASIWPHQCSSGRDWVVIDTDSLQVTVRLDTVAAFLADVALHACVNGVWVTSGVPDAEWEPIYGVEGGAA